MICRKCGYERTEGVEKTKDWCPMCGTSFVVYGSTNKHDLSPLTVIMVLVCSIVMPVMCIAGGIFGLLRGDSWAVTLLLSGLIVGGFWICVSRRS